MTPRPPRRRHLIIITSNGHCRKADCEMVNVVFSMFNNFVLNKQNLGISLSKKLWSGASPTIVNTHSEKD